MSSEIKQQASQTTTDPRKQGPKPPFDEPKQAPPGLESEMRNKPDHGEESYKGFGRLKGRKGADHWGGQRHWPCSRHCVRARRGRCRHFLPERGRRCE